MLDHYILRSHVLTRKIPPVPKLRHLRHNQVQGTIRPSQLHLSTSAVCVRPHKPGKTEQDSRGPIAPSHPPLSRTLSRQLNQTSESPSLNVPPSYTMATITATAPAETISTTTATATATAATGITASPPTTDWQLAHQHAQQRITRLQEQRATEASGRNRVASFFGGSNGTEGRPAFRVGQLDTELLDEELLELMKGQLWNGLKYFRVCFLFLLPIIYFCFCVIVMVRVSRLWLCGILADDWDCGVSRLSKNPTNQSSYFCFARRCSSLLSGTITRHMAPPCKT